MYLLCVLLALAPVPALVLLSETPVLALELVPVLVWPATRVWLPLRQAALRAQSVAKRRRGLSKSAAQLAGPRGAQGARRFKAPGWHINMPILINSAIGELLVAPYGWVWGCWAPHFRYTWPRQNRCQLHKFAASLRGLGPPSPARLGPPSRGREGPPSRGRLGPPSE